LTETVKLIVGLGNPGLRYRSTRHNVGFMVLDLIAERLGTRISTKAWQGASGRARSEGEELVLLKPLTYMNLSGQSVAQALRELRLTPEQLIAVYDDAHLDVGRIRLRAKGAAGGHKGVRSMVEQVGTDRFARVRIGIGGSDREDLVDHVLRPFSRGEWGRIEPALDLAAEAVLAIVASGIDAAMNRYNQVSEGSER
jgi:peptidyl-tRNA hydrolase, PTH1 family